MKKIVVIGPECTGKSTLCEQLANHYDTAWCREYARAYLSNKGNEYNYDDLPIIAEGQLKLEEEGSKKAKHGYYFIDTNLYVMKVWSEYVFGKCHQYILNQLANRNYDLYLLCNTDLPWTYDILREHPDEYSRKELFRMYHDLLVQQSTPWVVISGNHEERLNKALTAINRLI